MPPLPRHQTLYPRFFKRLLDIAGALVLLSLLAPFLLLLALIIAVNSRGCPIFTQWRIGRGCVPFRIIKFKTMNDRTGADGQLLPDSERTTSFGSLLRCTSLDELPELVNVLVGDMSFIGPRPWIPEQMDTFTPSTRRKRMTLRPGITGLAQIHLPPAGMLRPALQTQPFPERRPQNPVLHLLQSHQERRNRAASPCPRAQRPAN